MNIARILLEQADVRPDAPAIIDRAHAVDRAMTFAQLNSASGRGARLLSDLGLGAGDAALILQPMSAALYVTLLALFRIGMVAMFIDPSSGRKQIEHCLAHSSAQGPDCHRQGPSAAAGITRPAAYPLQTLLQPFCSRRHLLAAIRQLARP